MNTITRLFDFPYHQLEKYNLTDSLVTKYGNDWVKTSTQEYLDKANAVSRGLLRLGINVNDKSCWHFFSISNNHYLFNKS